MNKNYTYVGLIVLLVFITSCKKEISSPVQNLHTDYFTLEEGRYIEYDATEIFHDDASGIHDTTFFKLKTVVGQPYIDNIGRVGREIERYKSFDLGISWQLTDVWTAFLSSDWAELVEENQRLIKLVFAPTFDKSWNINAFNGLNPQTAVYWDIHVPNAINTVLLTPRFASCSRIISP